MTDAPRAICCALALLLAGFISACTPEQADESDGGLRFSLPLENFCPAFLSVFEAQQTRCGNGSLGPGLRAELMQFCEGGLVASVRQGVITYDPRQATACLTSYQQSCDLDNTAASCSLAFQGKIEPGGECYFEFECADGGCVNNNACPGRCELLAQPGGSCSEKGCPRGTYCNLNEICATELDEGEVCPGGGCRSGLGCYCGDALCGSLSNDQEGVCQKPPALGDVDQRCSFDRACREGLFCLSDKDSNDDFGRGTCQAVKMPGDACDIGGADLNWFYNGCQGSLCGVTPGQSRGVCTLSEEGSACVSAATEFDVPSCHGDFFCDEEERCRLYEDGDVSFDDEICVRP